MAKVSDYNNSRIPIEEREEALFDAITLLDKESYNLYVEVIDLGPESFYKMEDMIERLKLLTNLFQEVKQAYEYLFKQEEINRRFAHRRHFGKYIIALTASMYTMPVNKVLGVASFYILARSANNYLITELKGIEEALTHYSDNQVEMIHNTLQNSTMFLLKKLNGKEGYQAPTKEEENITILANHFITCFLSGVVSKEIILNLSDKLRSKIEEILRIDYCQRKEFPLEKLLDLSLESSIHHKQMIKTIPEK